MTDEHAGYVVRMYPVLETESVRLAVIPFRVVPVRCQDFGDGAGSLDGHVQTHSAISRSSAA
jgi:hypothetical protein